MLQAVLVLSVRDLVENRWFQTSRAHSGIDGIERGTSGVTRSDLEEGETGQIRYLMRSKRNTPLPHI